MVLCLHSPTPKSFSSCNHQLVQLDYNLIVVKKGRFSKPKLKFIQSYHSFRWTGRHNPDWANAETRDKYLFQASEIQTNNNWCLFICISWNKETKERQVKNIKRINSRLKPIYNGASRLNLLLQRLITSLSKRDFSFLLFQDYFQVDRLARIVWFQKSCQNPLHVIVQNGIFWKDLRKFNNINTANPNNWLPSERFHIWQEMCSSAWCAER